MNKFAITFCVVAGQVIILIFFFLHISLNTVISAVTSFFFLFISSRTFIMPSCLLLLFFSVNVFDSFKGAAFWLWSFSCSVFNEINKKWKKKRYLKGVWLFFVCFGGRIAQGGAELLLGGLENEENNNKIKEPQWVTLPFILGVWGCFLKFCY